jgi:hypothetical protein
MVRGRRMKAYVSRMKIRRKASLPQPKYSYLKVLVSVLPFIWNAVFKKNIWNAVMYSWYTEIPSIIWYSDVLSFRGAAAGRPTCLHVILYADCRPLLSGGASRKLMGGPSWSRPRIFFFFKHTTLLDVTYYCFCYCSDSSKGKGYTCQNKIKQILLWLGSYHEWWLFGWCNLEM